MPKIEFGELEMAPITRLTYAVGTEEDSGKNENENEKNNNDGNLSTTSSEATMPEADEPDNLENSPILSDLKSERKVVHVKIVGINKIQSNPRASPRFMFISELRWSDERISYISRDHDDFFRYHCWLLDTFKSQAGMLQEPRTIPFLPGKKWFRNDLELAKQRRPLIEAYLNELTKITCLGDSYQAQAFFGARPGDPNTNDSSLQLLLKENENNHDKKKADNVKGSHDNIMFIHDEDEKEAKLDNVILEISKSNDKNEEYFEDSTTVGLASNDTQEKVLDMNVASL